MKYVIYVQRLRSEKLIFTYFSEIIPNPGDIISYKWYDETDVKDVIEKYKVSHCIHYVTSKDKKSFGELICVFAKVMRIK